MLNIRPTSDGTVHVVRAAQPGLNPNDGHRLTSVTTEEARQLLDELAGLFGMVLVSRAVADALDLEA